MERRSVNTLGETSQFVCSHMLGFWHSPYDATESELYRVSGMNFDDLDKLILEASQGMLLDSMHYFVLYDHDVPEEVHLVMPMLSRGSNLIKNLEKRMAEIISKYSSYASIELRHNSVSDAIEPWKLRKYEGFTTSGYEYSITIT